jgi:hypothetical protein
LFRQHPQRSAARDQDLQPRARRQQLGDLDGRIQDLLEIVQYQQQLPLAEMSFESLQGGQPAVLRDAKLLGDRACHQARV